MISLISMLYIYLLGFFIILMSYQIYKISKHTILFKLKNYIPFILVLSLLLLEIYATINKIDFIVFWLLKDISILIILCWIGEKIFKRGAIK
ncbi:MAG: hypothetical protein HRU03_08630 [Nanoarchaeales archaeon]|nr:hypothetical protein [Nanoarchaeales archaeon]